MKREEINQEPTQQTGLTPYTKMESFSFVLAVLIILAGVYALFSVLFYFFNWKADYSLLIGAHLDNPKFESFEYANPCGGLGARIGEMLIGRSFGLAGVIIPVYLIVLGVNILLRKKRLIINRDTLTVALVLILTSLTLGSIFGSMWSVFNSGLGGEFGVAIADILVENIGIGTLFLLLGAWIALGVYINSNFINVVNKAGSTAINSGDKILSVFKRDKKVEQSVDISDDLEEVSATEEDINIDSEPTTLVEPTFDESSIVNREAVVDQTPITPADDEDDPFEEFVTTEIPLEIEVAMPSDEVAQEQVADEIPQSENSVTTDEDDDPFTEIPIAAESAEQGSGTVVYVEKNEVKTVDINDIESELYDPMKDLFSYERPSAMLLEDYQTSIEVDSQEIYDNKAQIEQTLSHFGIPIQSIKATVGPTITLYEIVQAPGVKISKIQGLENDIAQSLKALGIRIIAPIPGKGTVGIEVPNRNKQIVSMRSSILSRKFQDMKAELPIVVGRTIQNENYVFDLAKMPHLLVAGATGQGKSVGLNAIITSLLYRKHPAELKFVMIDPKMVEFSPYRNLEHHFMAKMESEEDVIITDPKKAVYTLNALCEEMESRLKLLSKAGVRNIVEYNEKFKKRALLPTQGHFFMPYIVVVIDEFADLIMIAKEVETPVMRIAQKARAVGIHLIVATQRPDVKVITGGIKANFPARIAFRVTQMIDSRTIIDQPGANQLIGRGDMLFSKDGELTRIQCALVETDEVSRIVEHISKQQGYAGAYKLPDYTPESGSESDLGSESGAVIKYDSLFADIARAAVSNGSISTSAIQRNYEVGFNRAGRIMTQLERAGIVGRQEGAKPRDILYHDMQSLEAKLQDIGVF